MTDTHTVHCRMANEKNNNNVIGDRRPDPSIIIRHMVSHKENAGTVAGRGGVENFNPSHSPHKIAGKVAGKGGES